MAIRVFSLETCERWVGGGGISCTPCAGEVTAVPASAGVVAFTTPASISGSTAILAPASASSVTSVFPATRFLRKYQPPVAAPPNPRTARTSQSPGPRRCGGGGCGWTGGASDGGRG